MASNNYVQPTIPRFDGHYDHWSMLMENILRSKEYWKVIKYGVATLGDTIALTDAQQKEPEGMKLKDLKAKNYLFQAIDRCILETILRKDSSKDIWDSMKRKYQGSSRVKCAQLLALRRDFEVLQMKECEAVTDYCARAMGISKHMHIHGEKMNDTTIIEKLLRSLTPKFDYVVCSIEESNDLDELSFDELQSSLLVHEQKLKRRFTVEEQALKASSTSHFNRRGRDRGQVKRDCNSYANTLIDLFQEKEEVETMKNLRLPDHDKSKVEYLRCHRYGHRVFVCYIKLPNFKMKRETSSFWEETKESKTLLMVVHEGKKSEPETWFVDIGRNNHTSGSKSSFLNLDESFQSTVSFGDLSTIAVIGKGDINIKINGGLVETVSDLMYVPSLKINLLSAGQL
ncbi:uncharacterized protein LOC112527492 [Cynara cardunculus var. scolymus]|uniref:uncharacterized protein LOC112527492 n=1 Tax=Cynara cardunculus var. scolymus TaxID=59895 RepID=UPI000D630722|nr:uncharacterized protein LOC112527492 [Cynara cardunculus var. scolymus]